ncbi:MAG: AAA family ATPase [Lachnospiraceae bacterium]|nr:AAA family ATPase [Lachnospiraceae bacterium]
MNIAEAKEYIKDTVELYLTKDEFGDYRIPVVRQRPIFLLGAPGIGKTAVMSQIASELGIALVSYSMTHHTRQSALGLPFIREKEYGGRTYSVSEYTMSEIIASIYDTIEESGIREGILFLDEINCVSETLYPSMLQFLQMKVFGKHAVPEGWVIVTAGNPPEFNKAVREFDVVTLDRLKVIEVEADYPAWKKYATERGLHGAVLQFLDSDRDAFYGVETTAYGKNYVTARGWEDLSEIITLYESTGKKVSESLIGQYIKNDTVVKEFSAFYDLYNKYKRQYNVDAVFRGEVSQETIDAAQKAATDERLALAGLLADAAKARIRSVMKKATLIREVRPSIERIEGGEEPATYLRARKDMLRTKERAGSLSPAEKNAGKRVIAFYEGLQAAMEEGRGAREYYNSSVFELQDDVRELQEALNHLFAQAARLFGRESNEMLVLVTELTVNEDCAGFFASFPNAGYEEFRQLLMVGDRREQLRKEVLEML